MATYIKTLKEDNGDITYPQTKAGAVLLTNGSDLETEMAKYVTAEDIASTSAIDLTELLSKIYPVGSIYMSATLSTTSQVAAALGGTWVAWGAGRVPVGVDTTQTEFDTVEETGGSKYLQQHSHNTINWAAGYQTGSQSNYFTVLCGSSSSNTKQAVANAGTGDSGNLQPYITCYMYKRTA